MGNQVYYRWVKASERLPDDKSKMYFIIWKHSLTETEGWEVLYGYPSLITSPEHFKIEWLEPIGESNQDDEQDKLWDEVGELLKDTWTLSALKQKLSATYLLIKRTDKK